MSYSRRSRYSPSSPPHKRYGRSVTRSRSRSRSWSYDSSDIENPGNNLYVTEDVHLVVDPWTRESRGFGFVTMSNIKEADRCIKYLDGSVLEGRVISVEKARRRRGRTPTPGKYLGPKKDHVRGRSSSRDRSRSYSPYCSSRHRRSFSPYDSCGRSYSRSSSPYSRSPVGRHDRLYTREDRSYRSRYYRDYSPDYRRDRSYTPEDGLYRRSRMDYSPGYRRSYRSRSRYYSRDYSPDDRRYYRSRRYRSVSRSISSSPRGRYRGHSPSVSPVGSRRRSSIRVSPRTRSSRRRSYSPVSSRSYSRSVSVGSRTPSSSSVSR
ncbi:Nucleotide-binding, alpha-beta plait [Cynara cardunculus var. scolymus]|uniref:Nucleotide-binding, alpha-beta plait n=1 Tax=Cynara cardunculus var. scolymus TaxID=59895 RepID=A0A103Y6Y4_CYNCS|nr:Nucleotide-binding, alpha-beta plait [Cynara cardunculus var. scolymus]